MTETRSAALPASFSPLRLETRSRAFQIGAVLLGTLFLALSSWIEVPMFPVPMTMQTFAITVVGAFYGWRLGGLTILAWLGEAMVGLPVLAGGAGGLAHFAGPTLGYLVAFPIAGALVGYLAEQGWTRNIALGFAAMLLGNALCLVIGGAYLASLLGPEQAMALGVTPFILGGILKSALAALMVKASYRLERQ
ncbi:biotin transport system substrate-specific component [Dongia mobilis]|uniref:Biotin transporter n=1 Tax=Dongia mobilis TaxID=578943 RepID=A0A4R6WZ87_9PROT|nr:biotin transporter BioY [Dongia mobilis]TDQ83127.1 biotin transport system substrate-specific component [Dongia mobilis]